jgi:hypothetical protein
MKVPLTPLAALLTLLIATSLAVVSWWSPRETPGTLGGVAIGSQRDGWARISFRHLACAPLPDVFPDPEGVRVYGMRCSTQLAILPPLSKHIREPDGPPLAWSPDGDAYVVRFTEDGRTRALVGLADGSALWDASAVLGEADWIT